MQTAMKSLIALTLIQVALTQCTGPSAPLEPSLVGKAASGYEGCSPGGYTTYTEFRVEPWGVFFQPFFSSSWPPGCPESIVSIFRKSNKIATMYCRPWTNATDFPNADPNKLPCHKVPVQKIEVWGPGRKKFISLTRKMIIGIKHIREQDCTASYRGADKWRSPSMVKKLLDNHKISNAALTYLYNIAYSNFFCI